MSTFDIGIIGCSALKLFGYADHDFEYRMLEADIKAELAYMITDAGMLPEQTCIHALTSPGTSLLSARAAKSLGCHVHLIECKHGQIENNRFKRGPFSSDALEDLISYADEVTYAKEGQIVTEYMSAYEDFVDNGYAVLASVPMPMTGTIPDIVCASAEEAGLVVRVLDVLSTHPMKMKERP